MAELQAEPRMLIDGKLTDSISGKTFSNINPATEEVIGEAADGTVEDIDRAIAAARTPFDDTDWSTNRALRKRCLEQLKAALDKHREDIRPQIVAEIPLAGGRLVTLFVPGALQEVISVKQQGDWSIRLKRRDIDWPTRGDAQPAPLTDRESRHAIVPPHEYSCQPRMK